MNTKRGRGRPPGEGIKDGPILMELATAMLADLRTKIAPLVRRIIRSAGYRVLGASELATIRRIQDKWKAGAERYMDQARAQLAMVDATARPPRVPAQRRAFRQSRAVDRALRDLGMVGLGSGGRAELATGKAFGEAYGKIIAQISGRETAVDRAMRAFNDSPTQNAMRAFYNDPVPRAMRELPDSPTQRAMRAVRGKD